MFEVAIIDQLLMFSFCLFWRNFTSIWADFWRSEYPAKSPNRGHPYVLGTTIPYDIVYIPFVYRNMVMLTRPSPSLLPMELSGHRRLHTHTENDKLEAAFTGHAPQPSGWAPWSLSRDLWASTDSLLEPGQVLTGAPTVTPTVVWAPEVPPGPQRHMLQPVVLSPQPKPGTHLYS